MSNILYPLESHFINKYEHDCYVSNKRFADVDIDIKLDIAEINTIAIGMTKNIDVTNLVLQIAENNIKRNYNNFEKLKIINSILLDKRLKKETKEQKINHFTLES